MRDLVGVLPVAVLSFLNKQLRAEGSLGDASVPSLASFPCFKSNEKIWEASEMHLSLHVFFLLNKQLSCRMPRRYVCLPAGRRFLP